MADGGIDGGGGGRHLIEWIVELTELCTRVAGGAGTPDDIRTFTRLLDGASFGALLGEDTVVGNGTGLVTRYRRFWAALDHDPDALAAVAREARGWPPSIVDAAMAYVYISEWKAMAMMRALAEDEAQGTQRLSDASVPERLVTLLGNAIRHAAERAPLSGRDAAVPRGGSYAGDRAPMGGRGSLGALAMYDAGAAIRRGVPPSPVVDPYPRVGMSPQSSVSYDAYEHTDEPVVVVYRDRNYDHRRQHDDQAGNRGSPDCSQEGAWWARICHIPGQDPHP
ncbi:hypothetical protein TW95_gp0443 [Pandoravirus inopinatum]|uniref:Uncharacterized protein n=1 Tax=Pandoravirus inopinatum TaxID=1605721 RepID=A0A0B5JC79_9VIRU|nr:hypothetical protein TW95_gp0443 [Pandoravirus inopinatum]AJF97177.1 hypothetical protein [Pandoravirus inopinatum]